MQTELRSRLEALARTPLLLVACDYDGTLANLVPDPSAALPARGALDTMTVLDKLSWTSTAIVSGRAVKDLRQFLGGFSPSHLVGSHGAEWQREGLTLADDEQDRLRQLIRIISEIADAHAGVRCEIKPAGVALHVRSASPDVSQLAIALALTRCESTPGVHIRHGSQVVEFLVVNANKGDALKRIRHALGASGVLFIGDDLTDEDAFRTLRESDVAIKVGEAETIARHRVDSVADVIEVLGFIAAARAEWAGSRNLIQLDRCAILSDQRTAAVISPGARISWLCLPRLDSSAVFAELLGDAAAGFFEIAPIESAEPIRSEYLTDSFIHITEWPGLKVTDYLDCSTGRAFQRAGRTDLIRVIEGTSAARIRFAPRLDYGRIATQLKPREGGIFVEGSNDPIALRSGSVSWTIHDEGVHQTAEAIVDPSAGPIVLELCYGTARLTSSPEPEPERRESNRRFWSGWASSLKLPRAYPNLVKRSALALKSLCYGPSGAIAAAATSSLPEHVGGVRNWDYRYCWPRDAAKAAASLVRLGNMGHALKLLDWLLEVVDRCESPDRLHPIYTLTGNRLSPEADIGHLAGYGQSFPVRTGNAAAHQVQLDVFGPIVHLVAMLAERGAPISPDHWRLVRAMVRAVESRWTEPDHGIWEMRLERRHHVHSKVMCWQTVDRALVVEEAMSGTQNSDWIALRAAIQADVLSRGFNQAVGAFTGAYGHDYLDAAVLKIGLTGFLDSSDPRWLSTVNLIERELRDGPTVRRYRIDDGLPGGEGGMHICTGWLIESLLSVGRVADARQLFDQFAGMFTGSGILTEQFDTRHQMAVGNLPQAYSHLAFIDSAVAFDQIRD